MGKPLLVILLVLVAAGISALPSPEEGQTGRIEAYERQRDGRTHLLLRIEGKTPRNVDQIVVKLPPGSDTREYEILAPASWSLEKPSRLSRVNRLRRGREPRLVLMGPPVRTPVYVRLQGPRERRIGVEASLGGKPFLGVTGLPVLPFPAPEPNLAGVARFPPIVSPGEAIEFSPVDLRRTPAEGVWRLEGGAAEPAGEGRLRVRIPPDARPTSPLIVTYTDPWGERTVAAPALGQVRVLPPPEGAPGRAQAEICGSELVQGEVCACGWLPGEARSGFRIDGAPKPPVAASQQSVCFSLPPGGHQFSGPGLPDARLDLQSVTIQVASPPPARPGQPFSVTWTVLGTSSPMRVQLRNTTPQVVRLEGGDLQLVATSGGEPNTFVRTLHPLAVGGYHIQATLPGEITPFQSRAYLKILEKSFQRELSQTADRFAAARRRLESSNARYYQAADVQRLVKDARSELLGSLAQPELAAFRDYADDELSKIEGRIAAEAKSAASPRPSWHTPVVVPAAFQRAPARPAGAIEKKEADSLLKRAGDFLNQYRRKPLVRHLWIQSLPEWGAAVRIYPRSYPSVGRTGFTDQAFCNLPLGRYEYEVYRAKYKPITGNTIDLVRDEQQALDCQLQRSGKAVPCGLVAGVARGCQ